MYLEGSHKDKDNSTCPPLIIAGRIVLHAASRPLRHSSHITSLSGMPRPPCLLRLSSAPTHFFFCFPSLFLPSEREKTNTLWLMFYSDIYPESFNGLHILPSNVWQMIVILLNARDYFVIHRFDLSSAHKIFFPHRTGCFIRPLKPLLSLFLPSALLYPAFFSQASRDEGYEVDEDLAQQDATSLFEVLWQMRSAPHSFLRIRDLIHGLPRK